MIFGKSRLELKVGIFVFVGLAILSIFILYISDIRTWGSGYNINITFDFINGIKLGAPVRFAGVDMGEVKKIDLFYDPGEQKTKIRINCLLRKEAVIPVDSSVWVNTLGLLGEKYIEIMPGKDYSKCLKTNDSIVGNNPVPMHEVFEMLKNIAVDIDQSVVKLKNGEGTIGKLLYNDSIYNELEGFIGDLRRNPWKLFWKTKEKPKKK